MTHEEPSSIAESLDAVRARIAAAAARSNRDAATVRLIAVSKTVSIERLNEAVVAGIHDFGENYVQEWRGKADALAESGAGVTWHFIGRLQRNKVKYVVGRVELIHAIDSMALAEEVAERAASRGIEQRGLLEVNVAGEGTKAGFEPDAVASAVARIARFSGLRLDGLMTMPPAVANPEAARGWFRALCDLRMRVQEETGFALPELSMGMSGDFAVAIEEGATIVRVGAAIFGERTTQGG